MEINGNHQCIRHSGVGGHHHNGVAENSIGNIVRSTRSMMCHTALRWPKCSQKDLWPMAIQQAVTLYNTIPKEDSGLSPEEIWCKSKSTHSVLRNAHPWGCPIYVLDPTLQDGQKIPKWKPRSRE